MVAVPFNKESFEAVRDARYRAADYRELLAGARFFRDGRGPDVLHAWTPRELVSNFCAGLRERYDYSLFVHLEDNEPHLLSCALGMPWEHIASMSEAELDRLIPSHLSHPRKSYDLLSRACGVSVIIDRLRELVPPGIPTLELWPSADQNLFKRLPSTEAARRSLGIPVNSTAIAYTGNVHEANAQEVRSIYLAVAVLNREGHPATLLRTGRDFKQFLGPDERWARKHSIELGQIPRSEVPSILSVADVLVQPGVTGRFNDYRFPSKLPEFLSAGKPTIVPAANIGLQMVHGTHAYILPSANALAIAQAVRTITSDPALSKRLAAGARQFFEERLSWDRSVRKLSEFYGSKCSDRPCETLQEQSTVPDLLALARSTAR